MILSGLEKKEDPWAGCQMARVTGPGRQGRGASKWHCYRCALSRWSYKKPPCKRKKEPAE